MRGDVAPELAGNAAPLAQRKRHRLERVQPSKQGVDLEGARQTAAYARLRLESGDVFLAEQNLPGVGRQHAGHQIDQCGLTGAVRPDQRVARTHRQLQLNVAGNHQRAEALRQVTRGKGNGGQRCPHRPMILDRPPRIPFGRNMTTTTSSTPIQKYQYCGAIPENWSRATMKRMAPPRPPYSRPAPPSTSITRSSAERSKPSESSETVSGVLVSRAPAAP